MGLTEAKALLAQHKYKEAADMLDDMLRGKRDEPEVWYLRGVAALKLKNYDGAQGHFEQALMLSQKGKYYQMKGMAHFEIFDVQSAAEDFLNAHSLEPDDVTNTFFLAMCYMLMDDPRAEQFLARSYEINKNRTKQLLRNFFAMFIKDDPRVSEAMKQKIEEKIERK